MYLHIPHRMRRCGGEVEEEDEGDKEEEIAGVRVLSEEPASPSRGWRKSSVDPPASTANPPPVRRSRVQLQSPPTQGEGVGPLAARDEETGVGAVVTGVGAPPPEDGDSEDGQSKYQGEGRPKGTAANRVRRRKGARKITAKDVPFPSFHTSEDVWNTRFPSRWLDVAEDIELEEPLKAPRLRVPPVRKRLLDELRSRPKTRWAKFVAWSKEYLCCCLVGCCRRNVEEKKGFEAEKLVEVVDYNLAFQDLGDSFQHSSLRKILLNMENCGSLNLSHNSIHQSLSGITLPHCTVLNLDHNEITSFASLPSCPKLRTLYIAHNHIRSLKGLERFPKLEEITLEGNPIMWEKSYTNPNKFLEELAKCCPRLRFADSEFVQPQMEVAQADTEGSQL